MLSKKYTVKGTHAIRRSEVGKLKGLASKIFTDEKEEVMNNLFTSTRCVSEQVLLLTSRTKCSVYLFDGIPLFVSAKFLNIDISDDTSDDAQKQGIFFPTLFFWLLYRKKFDIFSHLETNAIGNLLLCRGATSRFLIAGANLMIPGIISSTRCSSNISFIFSLGMRVPYAVGIVSNNFLGGHASGVGVYVLHCYKDCLWTAFENAYVLHCNKISRLPFPSEFTEKEVLEGVNTEEASESCEIELTDEKTFYFSVEDAVMFCFVETIKKITPKMLPLRLSYFMSLFFAHFPRNGEKAKAIDFKDTKYKKCLTFLESLNCITIQEIEKGVHNVVSIGNYRHLIQEHDERYKVFLEEVHIPAIERETLEIERNAMKCDSVEYSQKIQSISFLYQPLKAIERAIAYVLLLGREVDNSLLFPSLSEPSSGISLKELDSEVNRALNSLYTEKEIIDNVTQYIEQKSLFAESDSDVGTSQHLVKIEGPLCFLRTNDPAVEIRKIYDLCLELFTVKYDITIQTNVEGISMTNLIPVRHILKEGKLPVVSVCVRRGQNKNVTVVQNLEAWGLTLPFLCKKWKKLFSTSCNVVDPDEKGVSKKGKKHPSEIHIGGNFSHEVIKLLGSELGIPVSSIHS